MNISYNWVKDNIKFSKDKSVEEIADTLTNIGLEVEKIHKKETIKGGLEGVVIGEVLECKKHPDADRLKLTRVNLGREIVQIVCGAPNVDKGQKVLVATVGTVLYPKSGEKIKIKKSKIRGEESCGMICAEDEIGMGDCHESIMVLDTDKPAGTPANKLFEIKEDYVFEIGLTPNRADAMSHYGVARDLYAYYKYRGEEVVLLNNLESDYSIQGHEDIVINVDTNLAPKYVGAIIRNVKIQESPEWLKEKLKSIDIQPKNNIVDITNYILHGFGQPLHAFDFDKIEGREINVRFAKKGEKIVALDEKEYELFDGNLMICDKNKPICFGGIMGGLNSSISENTTDIFLESAYFNPVFVRKTAKMHGFNTDASFRFERGIDPNITQKILLKAVKMIEDICGGTVGSGVLGNRGTVTPDFEIKVDYKNVIRLIGKKIPLDDIKNILISLDIKIVSQERDVLNVSVPPYRVDVQREEDIVEEILRIYGFNNVEPPQNMTIPLEDSRDIDINFKIKSEIANYLSSNGFYEMMNNSLVNENYNSMIDDIDQREVIKIKNPLSKELSVMRSSLLFGGLESIGLNINHKNKDLKFFEIGKVYKKNNDDFQEKNKLSIIITGDRVKENWNNKPTKVDFFYLKGILESLLKKLNIKFSQKLLENNNIFSDGITFCIKKDKIADIGIVRQEVSRKFEIKQEVIYSELDLDLIFTALKSKKYNIIKEMPKYPEVRRDLALVLDKKIQYKDLYNLAFELEKNILKEVNLFDIYQGDKIPEDKKSYAVSFILQDENKTLSDEEINLCIDNIQRGFEKKFKAYLR